MKRLLLKRTIIVIIMAILLLATISNIAFANEDNFNTSAFENRSSVSAGTSIQNAAGAILYIVKIIAVGIGLIMLAVLAMKYMLASAQDKASIKQSAVVYVVGAVVFFGAAGILNIIQQFVASNLN